MSDQTEPMLSYIKNTCTKLEEGTDLPHVLVLSLQIQKDTIASIQVPAKIELGLFLKIQILVRVFSII